MIASSAMQRTIKSVFSAISIPVFALDYHTNTAIVLSWTLKAFPYDEYTEMKWLFDKHLK